MVPISPKFKGEFVRILPSLYKDPLYIKYVEVYGININPHNIGIVLFPSTDNKKLAIQFSSPIVHPDNKTLKFNAHGKGKEDHCFYISPEHLQQVPKYMLDFRRYDDGPIKLIPSLITSISREFINVSNPNNTRPSVTTESSTEFTPSNNSKSIITTNPNLILLI